MEDDEEACRYCLEFYVGNSPETKKSKKLSQVFEERTRDKDNLLMFCKRDEIIEEVYYRATPAKEAGKFVIDVKANLKFKQVYPVLNERFRNILMAIGYYCFGREKAFAVHYRIFRLKADDECPREI